MYECSIPAQYLKDRYAQLKNMHGERDKTLLWLVKLQGGLLFQVVLLTHVIEVVVWRGHIHGGITSAYHMLNYRPVPKRMGGTGTRSAKKQNVWKLDEKKI